jgi:hypothetical protein
LETAAFLAISDVLKAAAEEKSRVRAATNFMVAEFGWLLLLGEEKQKTTLSLATHPAMTPWKPTQ